MPLESLQVFRIAISTDVPSSHFLSSAVQVSVKIKTGIAVVHGYRLKISTSFPA